MFTFTQIPLAKAWIGFSPSTSSKHLNNRFGSLTLGVNLSKRRKTHFLLTNNEYWGGVVKILDNYNFMTINIFVVVVNTAFGWSPLWPSLDEANFEGKFLLSAVRNPGNLWDSCVISTFFGGGGWANTCVKVKTENLVLFCFCFIYKDSLYILIVFVFYGHSGLQKKTNERSRLGI